MEGVPSARVLGRYALHGAIASGGMATVHYGRLLGAAGFARTVAIKRLHPQFAAEPEFVSMFVDEARLASRIRSPHVVPTLDVVATSGELFLVMEYVPGESLARLLRATSDARARVPIPVAVAVMAGALRGLHAAHEARNERGEPLGIVHRDVSPQNVIVGSDGLARVLDFGVAKASGRLQTTREGQLKGKLGYMGPEQLRGDVATRATDVYAASVVLWELLVGERLFKADNEGAVVTRVMQGNVTRPSRAAPAGLPAHDEASQRALEMLDPVVMRGIDRDPAKRFETARDMAVALEECVAPAAAALVGEWVEQLVGPVLAERAAQIAAIESGASGDAGAPVAAEGTIAESIAPGGVSAQSTQASSISVTSNARRERMLPRVRTGRTIAAVAAAAVVLAAPLVVYLRMRSPPVVASPIAASTTPAATGEPAGASATVQAAAASVEAVDAQASLTAPGPPPTIPTAPAIRRARPPSRPSDCNPPFTWDAEGKKHYKASCL